MYMNIDQNLSQWVFEPQSPDCIKSGVMSIYTNRLYRIILWFRKPFLSFYIYLLLICLFMFILIFLCCSLRQNDLLFKILRSLPFWKRWNFSRWLCVCADKHRFNPMLTSLLRHSNGFDQSNRVSLALWKQDAIWLVETVWMTKERCQHRIAAVTHKNGA